MHLGEGLARRRWRAWRAAVRMPVGSHGHIGGQRGQRLGAVFQVAGIAAAAARFLRDRPPHRLGLAQVAVHAELAQVAVGRAVTQAAGMGQGVAMVFTEYGAVGRDDAGEGGHDRALHARHHLGVAGRLPAAAPGIGEIARHQHHAGVCTTRVQSEDLTPMAGGAAYGVRGVRRAEAGHPGMAGHASFGPAQDHRQRGRGGVDAGAGEYRSGLQVARAGGPGRALGAQAPVLATHEEHHGAEHEVAGHRGKQGALRACGRGRCPARKPPYEDQRRGRQRHHQQRPGRPVQQLLQAQEEPRALDHRVQAVVQPGRHQQRQHAGAERRHEHGAGAAPGAPGVVDDDQPDDQRGGDGVVQVDHLQAAVFGAEQQSRQHRAGQWHQVEDLLEDAACLLRLGVGAQQEAREHQPGQHRQAGHQPQPHAGVQAGLGAAAQVVPAVQQGQHQEGLCRPVVQVAQEGGAGVGQQPPGDGAGAVAGVEARHQQHAADGAQHEGGQRRVAEAQPPQRGGPTRATTVCVDCPRPGASDAEQPGGSSPRVHRKSAICSTSSGKSWPASPISTRPSRPRTTVTGRPLGLGSARATAGVTSVDGKV